MMVEEADTLRADLAEAIEADAASSEADAAALAAAPDPADQLAVERAEEEVELEGEPELDDLLRQEVDEHAGRAGLGDEVASMLSPLEAELREHSLRPADAVRRLVDAEQLLRRDPAAGLGWIASNYATALRGTPQAANLVRSLAIELGIATPGPELQAAQQQAMRQAEAQAAARAGETIKSFAARHRDFEAYRQAAGEAMMASIKAGRPLTLEQAFRQAKAAARPKRQISDATSLRAQIRQAYEEVSGGR